MKLYIVLGLLFVGVHAEKKLNLEDIERDNLRAENKVKPENLRAEETKYLSKSEVHPQQYQGPSEYSASTGAPASFVTPPPAQDVKYNAPSDVQYPQTYKYETIYQQQNGILPEQNTPLQYYSGYQHQLPLSGKGAGSNIYESQQLLYQPEVVVGNQLQSIQQKALTEKYAKNVNRETYYIDVPMTHLFPYYPHLDIASVRGNGLSGSPLVPQLATAATQQISIPLYTSALSQKPIIPLKQSYQIQYAPKYTAAIPSAFTGKIGKGFAYTTPVTSKKFSASSLLSAPFYFEPGQLFPQGKKFSHTQAYVTSPQTQYVPRFVYTQPTSLYTHASSVYPDPYTRASTYVQDNSLHGNVNQYTVQPQQIYVPGPSHAESPKQVAQQEISQPPVAQDYVKIPEEPSTRFVPPQYPAQDFKSGGATQLLPVHQQVEESFPAENHDGSSEPRSLLESYVPSKVIAAQDSARYRERPIKLEGGFLPSQENFLHKKRKSE